MTPKGRVQLAVTQDMSKAKARFPWATAFIWRRYGIWCFERGDDARAVLPGEAPRRSPRKPRKETL